MAEERTVSNFTKLNSADRANQKVSTLVHMTQVRQHYRRQHETDMVRTYLGARTRTRLTHLAITAIRVSETYYT